MRRSGNSSWIFWLILFVFLGGGIGAFLPLLLIIAVVVGIAMASVSSYKNSQSSSNGYHSYTTHGNYHRSSSDKVSKINLYLRKYFRTRTSILVVDGVELRLRDSQYASLASLDVYRNNAYICSLNEYQRRYPESYNAILNNLVSIASTNPIQDDVFEAEVVENPQPKQEAPKRERSSSPKEKRAQYFMDTINELNNDIPDEEITNGLYETCSLLKQIQTLEEKFPNSKDKLKKLYEYYLPILIKILTQYTDLQYAKTDPSYEETKDKLIRTIHLINDAMEKIISSMTDEDFINLSADISTLEAVLKKDGLTEDGSMRMGDGK